MSSGARVKEFIGDFGVLDRLVCDESKERTAEGTDSMLEVRMHGVNVYVTEPEVEGVICELRNGSV